MNTFIQLSNEDIDTALSHDLREEVRRCNKHITAMQARIEKATALIEKWRSEADPDGNVDPYDDEVRATFGTLLYCSNELQNALKGDK